MARVLGIEATAPGQPLGAAALMHARSGSAAAAMVLSGGGIRFATHAGVIAEMATWRTEHGTWLQQFPVWVGTSAGAVYAAFYAAGYSPEHIARLATVFTEGSHGKALFDINVTGAATAFLRHDPSHVLGFVRGDALLSFLETVLSKPVRDYLAVLDPAELTPPASDRHRSYVLDCWKKRRSRRRDSSYYADQITFGDCRQLFLIGVNAYTGQKTVYAHRDYPGEWDREQEQDQAMADAWPMPYCNPPGHADLQATAVALHATLDFRRFKSRIHRGHDLIRYGKQLPLALAVRASLSIPVIFEPMRMRRWSDPAQHHPRKTDLFVDGGVDDNFSLSVATDPLLGNARDVLGVSLGNLGYRLPDRTATTDIKAMLTKAMGYMGDTILDLQVMGHDFSGSRIAIVNALSSQAGSVTDTELIPDLIGEGRAIAGAYWAAVNGTPYPGGEVTMPWSLAFAQPEVIFLSEAARGVAPPPFPNAADRETPALRDVLALPPLRRTWLYGYAALALIALGIGTALYEIVEAVIGVFWPRAITTGGGFVTAVITGVVLTLVGVWLIRLYAYFVSTNPLRFGNAETEP